MESIRVFTFGLSVSLLGFVVQLLYVLLFYKALILDPYRAHIDLLHEGYFLYPVVILLSGLLAVVLLSYESLIKRLIYGAIIGLLSHIIPLVGFFIWIFITLIESEIALIIVDVITPIVLAPLLSLLFLPKEETS